MYKTAMESAIHREMTDAWGGFIDSLEKSLDVLEKEIDEAAEMSSICTDEWCLATEHVLDEIANSAFAISEPRWSSEEHSKKLKDLKGRIHSLYVKHRTVIGKQH